MEVTESAIFTPLAATEDSVTGKRWRAILIKSGWGSNGYYTEQALRNDGTRVFPKGTLVFLDHATPEERESRPFGSVDKIAGYLVTDAVWNAEESGLEAEVEFIQDVIPRVNALHDKVGLSIRASVKSELGNMDGKRGRIITELVGSRSVDLVVRAGAGGRLLEVLESETDTEMDEQMEKEILDAVADLKTALSGEIAGLGTRLSAVEESLAAEAEVVETAPSVAPAVSADEIRALFAEELAKLPQPVAESAAAAEGDEEDEEVEESATKSDEVKLPKRWAVSKGNN